MAAYLTTHRRVGLAAELYVGMETFFYAAGAVAPVFLDLAAASDGSLSHRSIARAVERSVRTFAVNPQEAKALRALPGVDGRKIDWCRNGVDIAYWRPDEAVPRRGQRPDVLFESGGSDRKAAAWLAAFAGRYRLGVISPVPLASAVRGGARHDPIRLDPTDDIRPDFAAARTLVVPQAAPRTGRLLEAMAMAVPAVAPAEAITGIGAEPGYHAVAAETPAEALDAVARLLDDPVSARRIGNAGMRFARRSARWDIALERFMTILRAETEVAKEHP